MKKLFILFVLLSSQAFSSDLMITEGDQYFGRSDNGSLCAIAFDKIETGRQNILGYTENFLHVSIDFVDSEAIEKYTLRNKAERIDGVFTPLKDVYFGKKSNQAYFQDSSLLLDLNSDSMLPESYTYIYYFEGKLIQRRCVL